MRGFAWLVLSVIVGLLIGPIVLFPSHISVSGPFPAILLLVLLVLFFGGVPWLALRGGWRWWIATTGGLVLGGIGAVIILIGFLKVVSFCLFGPCAPPNPYADALIVVVPLGVMGIAQALTLRGNERKIGWLVTTLIAAIVLPYGVIVAAKVLGEDINNPALPALVAGGAAWGVVTGSGLWALTSAKRG